MTVIGAGYGVVKLLSNKSGRKQAEENFQLNCRQMEQTLSQLYQEHAAYEEEFASYDAYMDEIERELEMV